MARPVIPGAARLVDNLPCIPTVTTSPSDSIGSLKMKVCPFCAESIQDAAIVCKHCGRELSAQAAPATPPATKVKPKAGFLRVLTYLVLTFVGIVVFVAALASQSGTPSRTAGID